MNISLVISALNELRSQLIAEKRLDMAQSVTTVIEYLSGNN